MGISDELKRNFGQDFFTPTSERTEYHNWHEVCVCGHIDRYHAETVGGTYELPPVLTRSMGGEEVTQTTVFAGCNGAMPGRGFESQTYTPDREKHTLLITIVPTCPCEKFRAVARIDRPNRYFNQRLPRDRSERSRHPFVVGIRAFSTHLSKRKAALADPDWATAEFDRRFTWLPDARVCSLSKCNATADVWPVFVDADDRSELRCPQHR